MFSTLRNRFGISGVISVVALVFALGGGAFAANNLSDSGRGAAASVKKALKGPRGPRGLRGATGAAGPAGAKGDTGATGSAGDTGANGKSVTTTEIPVGEIGCDGAGGIEVEAEGSSKVVEICNGEEGVQGAKGSPWTAGGTLPEGATQTGYWATPDPKDEARQQAIISFSIPLGEEIPEDRTHMEAVDGNFADFCTGSYNQPTAPSKHLCIYGFGATLGTTVESPGVFASSGGVLAITVTDPELAFLTQGTWAVTG